MAGESQCCVSIREWTADDEVIVSQYQNADHRASGFEPGIGKSATNGEMVDDLLREMAGIFGWSGFCFVDRAWLCDWTLLFARISVVRRLRCRVTARWRT